MDAKTGWERIATALRAERGGRSREEIAEISGISVRSIQDYESGKVFEDFPGKMIALASFYGWMPQALREVYDGGQPLHRGTPPLGSYYGSIVPTNADVAPPGRKTYRVSVPDDDEVIVRQLLRLCAEILDDDNLAPAERLRQATLVATMDKAPAGDDRISLRRDDPHRERLLQEIRGRVTPAIGGVSFTLSYTEGEPNVLFADAREGRAPALVFDPELDELPEFFAKDPEILRDYEYSQRKVQPPPTGPPFNPDDFTLAARERSPEQQAQRDAEDAQEAI